MNAVATFLASEHDRLVEGFDPKVAWLRRRRKVVLHPRAAAKLL